MSLTKAGNTPIPWINVHMNIKGSDVYSTCSNSKYLEEFYSFTCNTIINGQKEKKQLNIMVIHVWLYGLKLPYSVYPLVNTTLCLKHVEHASITCEQVHRLGFGEKNLKELYFNA